MSYLSLYRKWRPKSFAEVVGQAHVVRTLRNALTSGRIAHAYLFCGPRGTGKTSIARLLAKGLNCEHGPTADPCSQCQSCERIDKGIALDVVEIDGASNRGIDEVRDLRENVKFAPTEGQYKVYIIDEVHMLTTDAFNALLKTLEEPPSHVVFVFATTEPHKIPATILSRCQRFDFRRFSDQEIAQHLHKVVESEGVETTGEALCLIARHAAGGMRDALGLLDQCFAFAEKGITAESVGEVLGVVSWEVLLEFVTLLVEKKTVEAIRIVREASDAGKDLRQFVVDTINFCRDLMLLKAGAGDIVGEVSSTYTARLSELAARMSMEDILLFMDVFNRAENEAKWASQPRLPVEMAVVRAAHRMESSGHGGGQVAAAGGKGQESQGAEVGQWKAAVESLRRELGGRLLQVDDELSRLRRALSQGQLQGYIHDQPGDSAGPVQVRADEGIEPTDAPGNNSGAPPEIKESSALRKSLSVGELSPGEVLAKWEEVLEILREQRKVTIAALLREGRPAKIEAGRLIVVFPDDKGFHKASLENNKNRNPVEQVLSGIFRRPIVVECRFESEVSDCGEASTEEVAGVTGITGEPQEGPSLEDEHPLVRAALDLFDGTLDDS